MAYVQAWVRGITAIGVFKGVSQQQDIEGKWENGRKERVARLQVRYIVKHMSGVKKKKIKAYRKRRYSTSPFVAAGRRTAEVALINLQDPFHLLCLGASSEEERILSAVDCEYIWSPLRR